MLVDVAYVGNRADDLLLFANYNQAAAQQRRRHALAAGRAGRLPSYSRHHLRLQRRQVALQGVAGQVRVARAPRRDGAQLADAVEGEGQRRQSLENSERQLPGAAGLPQPRRRLRTVGLPPAVQQHDQLRLGAAVRPRPALGRERRRCSTRSSAAGSSPAINTRIRRRAGDLHLHPADAAFVSGIAQDFRGANNYRPNVTCDPYAPRRRADDHQLVQPRVRDDADRSEPAVRQRARNTRARPEVLAARHGGRARPCRWPGAEARVPPRGVQPAQPDQLPRAERQPQRAPSARSPPPTIRASCSSASSCCGNTRPRNDKGPAPLEGAGPFFQSSVCSGDGRVTTPATAAWPGRSCA